MVTYDYSKEPNNPWDAATWDPRAQIDFMRRMRYSFGGTKGNAEARIAQRMAQSDTKGMPPSSIKPPRDKVYIIRGRPGAAGKDGADGNGSGGAASTPILGFTGEGPFAANERFLLAPSPQALTFPAVSAALSRAVALFAPLTDSSFVLTTDPDEYLASGDGVICTVTFPAGSQIGAFSWGASVSFPSGTSFYIVSPATADPAFGGVQILFRGDAA